MTVRVSKFYVDVLVSDSVINTTSVSHVISFTDVAAATVDRPRSISDVMTLVSTTAPNQELNRAVSSVLGFTDDAFGDLTVKELSVSSVVDLSDVVVLIGTWNRVSDNTLGLTDLAEGPRVLNVSASNVLTLTDMAFRTVTAIAANSLILNEEVLNNQTVQSVSNVLSLEDLAQSGFLFAAASNVLNLTQTVRLAETISESISDPLSLYDEALPGLFDLSVGSILNLYDSELTDLNNELRRIASSMLAIADEVIMPFRVYGRSLPDASEVFPGSPYLQLTQTVIINYPHNVSVTDTLALTDLAQSAGEFNVSASNFLSFSQSAGQMFELSAASTLELSDRAERRFYVSNVLNFNQIMDGEALKAAGNILALTQTLHLNVTFGRSLSHDLGLQQGLAYTLIKPDTECRYSPFLGAGSPIPTTEPVLSTGTLTLIFESTTLVLRNPEYNNQNVITSDRINRTNPGGSITIFVDPKWPKQQSLQVSVIGLTEVQVIDFLAFLEESLGRQIQLSDWEGRTWLGIVTTPDATVTRGKNCNHKLSFEFEGEIQ